MSEPFKLPLAHRDDQPDELLDALAREFPGMKIVCAGDVPDGWMPPEVQAAMSELSKRHEASLLNGTCIDCGAQMPGYPRPDQDMPEGWSPAEGWFHFSAPGDGGQIVAWQCPSCDAKENSADSRSHMMIATLPKQPEPKDGQD